MQSQLEVSGDLLQEDDESSADAWKLGSLLPIEPKTRSVKLTTEAMVLQFPQRSPDLMKHARREKYVRKLEDFTRRRFAISGLSGQNDPLVCFNQL